MMSTHWALWSQEELASLTSRQQQLTASESAAQQQLAATGEAYEQASAACSAAEGEMHRLSMALEDSEARLLQAQQKEGQVMPTAAFCCHALYPYCKFQRRLKLSSTADIYALG